MEYFALGLQPNRLKYRIPHRCQNGHLRWLYIKLNNDGFSTSVQWSKRNCNCPVFDIGEGFSPIGKPQQSTGLCDGTLWSDLSGKEKESLLSIGLTEKEWIGKEIFEGDILGICNNLPGVVFWDNEKHAWGLHEKYPEGKNDRYHKLDYETEPMIILGNIIIGIVKHPIGVEGV